MQWKGHQNIHFDHPSSVNVPNMKFVLHLSFFEEQKQILQWRSRKQTERYEVAPADILRFQIRMAIFSFHTNLYNANYLNYILGNKKKLLDS